MIGSVNDVAEFLKLSVSTVYRMTSEGKLSFCFLPDIHRYNMRTLEEQIMDGTAFQKKTVRLPTFTAKNTNYKTEIKLMRDEITG